MKRHISKLFPVALLACAIVGAPLLAQAQATTDSTSKKSSSSSTSTDSSAPKKKSGNHPFHGNLKSVDKTAKSITLGNSTYYITSETKIVKNDKPATLDDGVVGEPVSGYAVAGDGGKMHATKVTFGAKSGSSSTSTTTEKKKSKSSAGDTTTK